MRDLHFSQVPIFLFYRLLSFSIRKNGLYKTAKGAVLVGLGVNYVILEQIKIGDLHGLHGDVPEPPSRNVHSSSRNAQPMEVVYDRLGDSI